MDEHLCYWCNQPAKHFFKQSLHWCCSKMVNNCPGWKEKISRTVKEKHKKSDKYKNYQIILDKLNKGEYKCKYCGGRANYFVGKKMPCCSEKSKECPNYKSWLGTIKKKYYEDHPEFLEFQRKNVKKINNRPDVVEKKRKKMLSLHNGDCEDCVQFQEHYHEATINRKDVKRKKELKKQLIEGKIKCKYCGEVAKFFISRGIPCCCERGPDCENYKNWHKSRRK